MPNLDVCLFTSSLLFSSPLFDDMYSLCIDTYSTNSFSLYMTVTGSEQRERERERVCACVRERESYRHIHFNHSLCLFNSNIAI